MTPPEPRSRRHPFPLDLPLVAVGLLAVILQASLFTREAAFRASWEERAEAELTVSADRIVGLLREAGEAALLRIRDVGEDPDTHALLSAREELERTARRPVFLDLERQLPVRRGREGVTVYDATGHPRAWSGWAPTATTTLPARPPSSRAVVRIRPGHIYTLLEAIRPIPGEDGPRGYVVFQKPLRVLFPLSNRYLRTEDALRDLEGPGGTHAEVSLSVEADGAARIRDIQPGKLRANVGEESASAVVDIVREGGAPVGRVTLAGLRKAALAADTFGGARSLRTWVFGALLLLAAMRLWICFTPGRPTSVFSGLPGMAARLALLAGTRVALLTWTASASRADPTGIFDPGWFASIRYWGLLRSPGDLVLTAAAVFLSVREVRGRLLAREDRLASASRAHPFLLGLPGLAAAGFVGSLVGFHWTRVLDITRNANASLFEGLDPFAAPPVAALELGLLLGGAAFLMAGDILLTAASGLLSSIPPRIRVIALAVPALLASAVKMGVPDRVAAGDFARPVPALVVLAAFHLVGRRWKRPGTGSVLAVSVLAALANFLPLREGVEHRRRELVELRALEGTESPSPTRHFLLEGALEQFASSGLLRDALDGESRFEEGNLAFMLWAGSPLPRAGAGCSVRIRDASGSAFSAFRLDFPEELAAGTGSGMTGGEERRRFRRTEVEGARVDLYFGEIPVLDGEAVRGSVEVQLAFHDDLRPEEESGRRLARVFGSIPAGEDFLRFARQVPDRIDRYRGDVLVASTDPEGGLGNRVPSVIAEALNDPGAGGRWVERRIGGALYDVYCVREHDGHRTVGYLAYGLRRAGVVSGAYLLARVVLATLVLAAVLVLVAMLGSWVAPNRIPWMDIPRPGFRERVIAGFLLVSLLPTVLLGFAGRELFVQERRKEFRSVLEGNLRVAREILSRRLSDAARNAARSEEVRRLVEEPGGGPEPVEIPSPASADALVVVDADGRVVALSPGGEAGVPLLPVGGAPGATYPGYFRREGTQLFACASIPLAPSDPAGVPRTGAVLAFRRVDDTLVSELERRVGSPLSFFAGGRLAATSRPGLYQSEILSDLVDAPAFVAIELEGARTTLVERRVGAGAFLESCGPLPDETNQPAGMIVALSPFPGAGLDPGATRVLSGIYFLCLFVLAAAILAAVLLAGRLTRPIAALTAGAERVGGGELGHRIATRAGGEIGRLIDSFNAMSRRLATSEARDRERREYIEAIIRHVGSGVVSFDRSGRVATVNEAAARILGVDPGDLIGLRPGDAGKSGVVLAEAVPLFGQNAGEIVREIDLPGVAGGEDRTIRLLGTPLSDRSGVPQGAVVVFEDLTELIRSKKITAWAEMARQVAHEIKNPLTPMKLSAQQLREAWRDRHPKFDRILEESAETIIDRCEALRRIAVEFSDYARMPGRRILREDLGSLLGDAGRLCGEAGRGIELRMDLQKDEMPVRIDRDEVMRLFINLLENAVQAMPDGGRLEIAGKVEGDWAVARIGDTGQGIPAPNLERIFEPSFSTKTGGAGLGLPICRAIMEDYDGSIEITSELGRGTLVELHFPLARGDDPAEGEES